MTLDAAQRQEILDEEHLRLLSIGFIVSGGMNALFSLLGLAYVFMGIVMGAALAAIPQRAGEPSPAFMGVFIGIIGFGLFAAMVTAAVLKFIVARRLGQRRSRVTCMVVAGLSCIEIPYGTALGVATLIVLSRPSVARRFEVA